MFYPFQALRNDYVANDYKISSFISLVDKISSHWRFLVNQHRQPVKCIAAFCGFHTMNYFRCNRASCIRMTFTFRRTNLSMLIILVLKETLLTYKESTKIFLRNWEIFQGTIVDALKVTFKKYEYFSQNRYLRFLIKKYLRFVGMKMCRAIQLSRIYPTTRIDSSLKSL